MTENEAIRELEDYTTENDKLTISFESTTLARKALEEIQEYRELGSLEEILKVFNNQRAIILAQHETLKQYRAIGTPEYIVKMIDEQLGGLDILDVLKSLTELEQYRAIGTVEELKTLKENGAFTGVELAQLAAIQMRLKEYSTIGTVDEFKALKENQRKCKDCANERDYAITQFANFLHEKAKENNGLRLSSETRSWTHPCIFDYLKEFREKQIFEEETLLAMKGEDMSWYRENDGKIITDEEFQKACMECPCFCEEGVITVLRNGERTNCPYYKEVDTSEYDKEIRNEAIDEFKERLKDASFPTLEDCLAVWVDVIDEIAEEMKKEGAE